MPKIYRGADGPKLSRDDVLEMVWRKLAHDHGELFWRQPLNIQMMNVEKFCRERGVEINA